MNLLPLLSTAIHRLSRRHFIQYSSVCISSSIMAACSKHNQVLTTSYRLDKVTFSTNCIIQAKHGGFDQTIVTDTDKDHGLDITIKIGEL